MGTMMSLLSLQAAQAEDPSAVNALVNAQSRLKSMGVLYDKLYRSGSLTEMAIDQYLTALVMEIVATFPNSGKVSVRYAMDSWKMNPKILSNLGIIINEIISNSMKYAFNDKAEGTITISAQLVDGLATIGIADDGSGIPECIDPEHSPGFGLEMVRMLAEQMGGTFRYERCRGTRFLLEFKAEAS